MEDVAIRPATCTETKDCCWPQHEQGKRRREPVCVKARAKATESPNMNPAMADFADRPIFSALKCSIPSRYDALGITLIPFGNDNKREGKDNGRGQLERGSSSAIPCDRLCLSFP